MTQSNTTFHGCYDAAHVKHNCFLDTDMSLEAAPADLECDNIAFVKQTPIIINTVNINVGPLNQCNRPTFSTMHAVGNC